MSYTLLMDIVASPTAMKVVNQLENASDRWLLMTGLVDTVQDLEYKKTGRADCWCAHDFIAAKTGLSEITCKRSTTRLREQNYISVRHRYTKDGKRTANGYSINLEKLGLRQPATDAEQNIQEARDTEDAQFVNHDTILQDLCHHWRSNWKEIQADRRDLSTKREVLQRLIDRNAGNWQELWAMLKWAFTEKPWTTKLCSIDISYPLSLIEKHLFPNIRDSYRQALQKKEEKFWKQIESDTRTLKELNDPDIWGQLSKESWEQPFHAVARWKSLIADGEITAENLRNKLDELLGN